MSDVVISQGSVSDFRLLEDLHYRGRSPASIVRVLVARAPDEPQRIVGALVVTRPVLNATWRSVAWPGDAWKSRRNAAAFVNAHVRRIARVVVEVKMRGLGVASALVRAYLAQPLTTHTEAVAAMGRAMPLFERAGMREVAASVPRRTQLLARRLKEAGVEPWELMDARVLAALLRRDVRISEAFKAWARDSRHSRSVSGGAGGTGMLREAMYAASQVAWPARVFVTP